MISLFSDRKRKILRKVYGALSLSTALFVFQACYGTPHDMGMDVFINGTVRAKATNLPIQGIKVSVDNQSRYGISDMLGKFEIYAIQAADYKLKFQDIDSIANGNFLDKDTLLINSGINIAINISLDAK